MQPVLLHICQLLGLAAPASGPPSFPPYLSRRTCFWCCSITMSFQRQRRPGKRAEIDEVITEYTALIQQSWKCFSCCPSPVGTLHHL
ncbi:hypothetical protein QBC37DRAFT_428791 [Rhypophila decipiens]|uniref:Secreted protein n=1 Tax=Rhypophila decipiens TaxID=261697 RepID=A0AAN7B563_9PEZI|nr:hypothetical protein QBC37DRAFT_428791 [Rhypophila decipiens]